MGLTPLHIACRFPRLSFASQQQEQENNNDGKDEKFVSLDEPSLPTASEIVRILLDKGADPTRTNCDGELPFGVARARLTDVFGMVRAAATFGLLEPKTTSSQALLLMQE